MIFYFEKSLLYFEEKDFMNIAIPTQYPIKSGDLYLVNGCPLWTQHVRRITKLQIIITKKCQVLYFEGLSVPFMCGKLYCCLMFTTLILQMLIFSC